LQPAFLKIKNSVMTQMRIVNYKSAMAFYKVAFNNDQTFVATLEKYLGDNNNMPPKKVTYLKAGTLLPGNTRFSSSLLDDVSRATGKR
jgi:hypothetical protein